jgi:regulator of replication initiation timing
MTQQLDNIEQKVKHLAEAMTALRQQNASLLQENNKLKADLEAQHERIGELTERLTNSQQALAGQRGDDSENTQKLRKQIDQYIQEIDKCIEWLQNA